MRFFLVFFFLFLFQIIILPNSALSQYAPQAGNTGSSAIHRDSSIIQTFENIYWKSSENKLIRGWQNVADTTLGKATVGSIDSIENKTFMLSLGDGGSATFALNVSLYNGPGPDFVVFENGFPFSKDSFFLELAYVEVSLNGEKYYRFSNNSLTDTNSPISAFGSLKAHQINNLAGKYIAPYGVPFDLDELKDSLGEFGQIRYIRIVDVVGSLDPKYGSKDSRGKIINDPWQTPFPSSGFDLTGIGFIHLLMTGLESKSENLLVQAFPNPLHVNETLSIVCQEQIANLDLRDASGVLCNTMVENDLKLENSIKINVSPGLYFLSIIAETGKQATLKIIVYP